LNLIESECEDNLAAQEEEEDADEEKMDHDKLNMFNFELGKPTTFRNILNIIKRNFFNCE